MPYLGNIPAEAFSSFDKQTITGDGGTSYTLTHPVGSAQEVAIFVNNVRQEPGVAYTVTGTALTMTGNVESTDDFYAIFIGKAVQTVNPADNTVTAAMLQSGSVTNAKIDTMAASKLTGALPAIDGSALTGVNFITQADTWQNSANFTQSSGNNVDITTMVRNASDSFGRIGTGLSASSGVFTFPETGIYFINAFMTAEPSSGSGISGNLIIRETINGGTSYSSLALTSMANMASGHGYNWSCNGLMDVTDTTQVKFKLATYFSANAVVMGNTSYTITGVTVVRLGDT